MRLEANEQTRLIVNKKMRLIARRKARITSTRERKMRSAAGKNRGKEDKGKEMRKKTKVAAKEEITVAADKRTKSAAKLKEILCQYSWRGSGL